MKKKFISLFMSAAIVFSVAACGESSSSASGNAEEKVEAEEDIVEEPEEEAEQGETDSEEEEAETKMPGIPGSQVYDIIISLEDSGIPKADTVTNDDGFQYDSVTTDYAYSITANSDHEVSCAVFYVFSEEDTEGYLKYCASMPYDTSDSEAAQAWVDENLGSESETTFGEALYVLSVGNQGPVLTIKSTGFDDYVLDSME